MLRLRLIFENVSFISIATNQIKIATICVPKTASIPNSLLTLPS